jgi:hypothetical protein
MIDERLLDVDLESSLKGDVTVNVLRGRVASFDHITSLSFKLPPIGSYSVKI